MAISSSGCSRLVPVSVTVRWVACDCSTPSCGASRSEPERRAEAPLALITIGDSTLVVRPLTMAAAGTVIMRVSGTSGRYCGVGGSEIRTVVSLNRAKWRFVIAGRKVNEKGCCSKNGRVPSERRTRALWDGRYLEGGELGGSGAGGINGGVSGGGGGGGGYGR